MSGRFDARVAASSARDVASPCNGVCRIDPGHGTCAGCGRTIDEIAAWTSLDATGRRAVLARIARRASPPPDAAPFAR